MNLITPTVENISGKKVLVRVDYNVALKDQDGKKVVAEDMRIKNSLRTISFLLENNCKVILMSHLGRPKDAHDPEASLRPVFEYMKDVLKLNIKFADDCVGEVAKLAVDSLENKQILLLENLRYHEEEEKNDDQFAENLANLAEVYINEAFSNSHRKHASMVGVATKIPSFAGFSLKEEAEQLQGLMEKPKRPFIIVIGGAKISDKVEAVENLGKIADLVLIGGGVANNFLKAEGIEVHKSYLQDISSDKDKASTNYIEVANKLLDKYRTEKVLKDGYIPLSKILYPIDVVAAKDMDSQDVVTLDLTHDMQDTPNDQDLMYLDIGPNTIKLYQELILRAGTIFWNGPMGVFEKELFTEGTREITRAIAKSSATTVIGGGDTIAAINQFSSEEHFDYISTAGGASLDFLAGKKLPGLEVINKD